MRVSRKCVTEPNVRNCLLHGLKSVKDGIKDARKEKKQTYEEKDGKHVEGN